jgi:hypothetical protein
MHNMFLSGTDFWRYLDKAYNSVPGSGGSNPLHAFPCVHGLTVSRTPEAWIFKTGTYMPWERDPDQCISELRQHIKAVRKPCSEDNLINSLYVV